MSHHEKLKRMIDDNKIEEAANLHRFELIASMHGSTLGTPMQCFEEVVDAETELIENSFITGAKWAINEFINDLWHPASEEPREFAEVLAEAKITESIKTYISFKKNDALFKNWDAYSSGANITRWLYIDDLFPKEGDKK